MAEYLEKSKIKQYIKDFCKGLISDDRQFDSIDDCVLLNQMIDFAPAADVAEVVRCKNCIKGFQINPNGKLNLYRCDKWKTIMRNCDFCSFGERSSE